MSLEREFEVFLLSFLNRNRPKTSDICRNKQKIRSLVACIIVALSFYRMLSDVFCLNVTFFAKEMRKNAKLDYI